MPPLLNPVITMNELENIKVIRKSIVTKSFVKQGEVFTSSNLTCKRPAGGLSPMKWDLVIGQIANRDYSPNEEVQID